MTTMQRFDVAKTFGVQARPGLEVLGFAHATHPQIPVRRPYVFRNETAARHPRLHPRRGRGRPLSDRTHRRGQDQPDHPGRRPALLAGATGDLPWTPGTPGPGRPVRPDPRRDPLRPWTPGGRRARRAYPGPQRKRPDGPRGVGGSERHRRGATPGDRGERRRGHPSAPAVPGGRDRQQCRGRGWLGPLPRGAAPEPGLHGPLPRRPGRVPRARHRETGRPAGRAQAPGPDRRQDDRASPATSAGCSSGDRRAVRN